MKVTLPCLIIGEWSYMGRGGSQNKMTLWSFGNVKLGGVVNEISGRSKLICWSEGNSKKFGLPYYLLYFA